jgi:hypothetical protein
MIVFVIAIGVFNAALAVSGIAVGVFSFSAMVWEAPAESFYFEVIILDEKTGMLYY